MQPWPFTPGGDHDANDAQPHLGCDWPSAGQGCRERPQQSVFPDACERGKAVEGGERATTHSGSRWQFAWELLGQANHLLTPAGIIGNAAVMDQQQQRNDAQHAL